MEPRQSVRSRGFIKARYNIKEAGGDPAGVSLYVPILREYNGGPLARIWNIHQNCTFLLYIFLLYEEYLYSKI